MLAIWGGVLGLIFGAMMNIWFWPFAQGVRVQGEGGAFTPGMSACDAENHASSTWPPARGAAAVAVGNAVLILLFGGAIPRVLRRFKRRFGFELEPGRCGWQRTG